MDLRLKFREIIKARRLITDSKFTDKNIITNLLLEDYNETVKFLSSATNVEIACAIDALTNLVRILNNSQARKIIEIFKQKREQFENIQYFTSTDFDKEIRLAEQYINWYLQM